MSGAIDDDLMFDTFISYDKADQKWVTGTLIKKLEDANIKVCWDDRDFEPGKTVIENKLNAICSSSSTIVLLSPDYVQNEDLWSQLNRRCGYNDEEIIEEFQVIPVIVTNCKVPNIFAPLWKLDWTNELAKTFFWDKLIRSIRAFSDVAKTYDNSLGPKEPKSFLSVAKTYDNSLGPKEPKSRSFMKNSQKKLDEKVTNFFKSSKDILGHEQLRKGIMVEKDPLPAVSASLVEDEQEIVHLDPQWKKDKNGIRQENSQKIDQPTSINNISDENNTDTRPIQSVVVVDKDTKNEDISLSISKNKVAEICPSKNHGYEEDETEKDNKLLESMDPRILSIFSPEDDDLSRQDIEELTFKIEDVYLEDCCLEPKENDNHEPNSHETNNIIMNTNYKLCKTSSIKKRSKYGRFASQQEQMLILDVLQEKELILRRKFEKCCDYERKRVYKRLLERFGKAIFSTVNGDNDVELLASLPLSDLSLNERRGCKCCCCDQLFHSERALQMHINDCIKQAWISLMNDPVYKLRR